MTGWAGSTRPTVCVLAACLIASVGIGAPHAQRGNRTQPPPAAPVAAIPKVQQLQQDFANLLTGSALQRASWGIVVRSLSSNETLYSLNSSKLLIPASNMKIVTLATAASRLGWDFSFETRLVAAGPVRDGVLEGDLVVVGSGDPSIDDWDGAATKLFGEWADVLKASGVQRISGRIVGDDDSFDDVPWGSGWAWDDLDRSFATGVGTLQFNENTAQVRLTPGTRTGDAPSAELLPSGSGLFVRNRMTTSQAGSPGSLTLRRALDSPTIEVSGALPLRSGPVVRNVAVLNPTLYFTNALRDGLIRSGIVVEGEAVDIDDIDNPPSRARGTVLLSHKSPTLDVLATTMMRLSQNLYAETLLKAVGAQKSIGSVETGRAAVVALLNEWGLAAADLRLVDGSGLSTYDLVTPDLLAGILARVAGDFRLGEAFQASLPIAGKEGTLAQRMKGTPAEANVRAKTGSLSNVRSMSGYVTTADAEPLVFSIIVNNFGVSSEATDRAIDAMAERLATFSRR